MTKRTYKTTRTKKTNKYTVADIMAMQAERDKGMTNAQIAAKRNMRPDQMGRYLSPNWVAWQVVNSGKKALDAEGLDYNLEGGLKFLEKYPDTKEVIMGERTFTPYKELRDGQYRKGVYVTCSKQVAPDCLKKEVMIWTGRSLSPHPIHATRYFNNKGWKIGGGPNADVCPKCWNYKPQVAEETTMEAAMREAQAKQEDARAAMKVFAPAPYAPQPVANSSKPITFKEVSKEDRRIISAELDDVYDASKGGYLKGYNDKKVAEDLGCAVEAVAAVREFGFGPETSAADYEAEIKAIKALADEVRTLKSQVDASVSRLEEFDKALNERLANFEKAAKSFQSSYDDLMRKVILK